MEFVKQTSTRPGPGKEVDAYCAKCKLELAHVIIAMNGTKIAKVQCKTCQAVHAFRHAGTLPKSRAAKGSKKSRTEGGLTESEYQRLMAGRDISQPAPYRTTSHFEPHTVINHPRFGLGLVLRGLDDNKIEVAFPTGIKVLIHASEPAG